MTSRRRMQVALALWLAFAFVAWNALFDYLVVRAGRDYVHAAAVADHAGRPPLLIAEFMRPAVKRAFAYATIVGAVVLSLGIAGVLLASRKLARQRPPVLRS